MSEQRNRDLARIHIGRQQLAMSDDDYRAMLMTIGRVKSAAELDVYGRTQVLEHLKSLGWKPEKRKSKAALGGQDAKIRALWLHLADIGVVRNASEVALRSYVHRQTGCERLEWLTNEQASRLIESLKQWQQRVAS